MASDPVLVTSRITEIELRRNLTRLLDGEDLISARRQLQTDLNSFAIVEIDSVTCNMAAGIKAMNTAKVFVLALCWGLLVGACAFGGED